MKTFLLAAILSLSIALPAVAASAPKSEPMQVWREAEPTITTILESRQKQNFEALTKASGPQLRRLQKLIEASIDILAASGSAQERQRLNEIRNQIIATQKEIAQLRFEMATAPEASPGLVQGALSTVGIGAATKATYQQRIADAERRLSSQTAEQEQAKQQFMEGLSKIGVTLSPKQVDGLLAMATADDMIEMQVAFDNMKSINQALLDATIRTSESLEVAKRYYGIYAVMLEIAIYMHDSFVERVDQDLLPALGKIEDQTKKLNVEASSLLGKERDPALKQVLQRNVNAQELTLKAAKAYRDRLNEQRQRIAESANRLKHQHRVAVNTFRTVEATSDLVTMMRATGQAFESLLSLEIPALRPFESLEMQNEFEKLTNQLKGKPGV